MMKISCKHALSAALICLALGAALVVCGLIAIGFDYSQLAPEEVLYTTEQFTVHEEFRHIRIDAGEFDVRIVPATADPGRCDVNIPVSEKIFASAEVSGDTLTVAYRDARRWYEKYDWLWNTDPDEAITVHLPEGEYGRLIITSVSGDVDVPDGFSFAEADLHTTSGDIRITAGTLGLRVKSTSGDIYAANMQAGDAGLHSTSGAIHFTDSACGAWRVNSTSGDVTAENIRGSAAAVLNSTSGEITLRAASAQTAQIGTNSGDITLQDFRTVSETKLHSTSGDIQLSRADAALFDIHTTSGEVSGSLRSGKIFDVNTTSGTVHVPPSDTGAGKCRITTTSGNVWLEIAEN